MGIGNELWNRGTKLRTDRLNNPGSGGVEGRESQFSTMKKFLTLMILGAAALVATPNAEARPVGRTTYVSGHTSCGCPVYTQRYIAYYDHCGYPVFKYRRLPVSHRCRAVRPVRPPIRYRPGYEAAYSYQNRFHGNDYRRGRGPARAYMPPAAHCR